MPNNFYAPKPLNLVGRNDRLAMLLDMGVPPGEDASYEEQKQNLLNQKDKLIDNSKLNFLQKLESAIQTARNSNAPEGPLSPVDFATQTLAKSIPSPNEVNPDNIIKSIPPLVHGALDIAQHPIAALKQAALNGPPDPTTMAAIALPGAALNAYREMVPLSARMYLHHMAGIPTPFTRVNEGERQALTDMAQGKINELLDKQQNIDKVRAYALQSVNKIRLMNMDELMNYAKEEGIQIPRGRTFETTAQLRDYFVNEYKKLRPSMFNEESRNQIKNQILHLGDEADNANVRQDFENITGKKLSGFQIYPDEFATTFGKTYIEPMVEKDINSINYGRIIPKSIKDTYKFYPDVYGYDKGEGLRILKQHIADLKQDIKFGHKKDIGLNINNFIKNIMEMGARDPAGVLARKIGFRRPTSIIDIPLQTPAPMNAYDRAAILLGVKAAAEKKD